MEYDKEGTKKHLPMWTIFPGFCRMCWHKFNVTIDIWGMTLEQIHEVSKYTADLSIVCCDHPDRRVSPKGKPVK